MSVVVLVVAKAPVPGLAKTRLARGIGAGPAADLAAAALLDTLDAAAGAAVVLGGGPPVVALAGGLTGAARAGEVRRRLAGFMVIPQRGATFADRLATAHADCRGSAVLQIGTDTPQAGVDDLVRAAGALSQADAVLGPAPDGGWWLLGLRDPGRAAVLRRVPMSTPETGALTRRALERAGATVALTGELRDVDTAADAEAVAGLAPGTRFAAAHRARAVPA